LLVAGLAPAVVPAAARAAPDIDVYCNGSRVCEAPGLWFRSPVRVEFVVTGHTSTDCPREIWVRQDTGGTPVGCSASGGGTTTVTVVIRLDQTPPIVTGVVPARPPDHGPWYSHPITFTGQGDDRMSGLAGCDAPSYSGPDAVNATIVATCRDVAGNAASRAFPLSYDATPPDLSAATISAADRVVRVRWPAGSSATLTRTPGPGASANAVVYEGRGTAFADRGVRNNRQYRYVLTLTDAAGNAASREFVVTPRRQLLAPGKRAVVNGPPLLRWTPVRGARYYNVQVFRGKRKVLSAWPRRAALQLKQRWRYRGHRYRLREGRYRWYVWPGVGPRAANRYGERIGARTFVVDRGAGPAA
jgi:hypothetical protein